ncbi:MAG: phage major capsid protein [Reyranella sp.]|nr:phage major capsid protein [Reyranella sp.]
MKIQDLREKRDAALAEFRTLANKESAGEALADNERTRADALESEIRTLDGNIRRAETLAELERRADATPVSSDPAAPDLARYSLVRALRGMGAGRLDGLEAEMHQELSRGRGEVRGVMVPTDILLRTERRVSNNASTGAAGGFLVQTQMDGLADRFRPALMVEALGARVIPGLVGDIELPNLSASGTASWVGEEGAPARTKASFTSVNMAPRTVAAEYAMSRRLMLQTASAIEGILRADLGNLLATKLDAAALNGNGVGIPLGVLQAGITKVTTESDFSDTTANLLADLEMDDVTGTGAFLTSPKGMKLVRKVKESASDRVIPAAELFHGKRYEMSTNCPDTIGSSSDKTALIYGLWSELTIGYWSGVDILANPYHSDVASAGGQLLHAFLDCDAAPRRIEAFAYAELTVS